MPATLTNMSLHLRYRIWIAEMNSYINFLRIFDDYLIELESKKNIPDVITGINNFKQQFIGIRKEIDELKHEMHLVKMKLAAAARENNPGNTKTTSTYNHNALQKSYAVFKKTFNKVKKDFELFEGKWLN